MPGKMDGYQLAHWALGRQPELKVLITTGGSSARSLKHERTNNGNLPLLHKPYSEETLAETIRALLDQ
jgi:DNA-binding NtrC family response regulator